MPPGHLPLKVAGNVGLHRRGFLFESELVSFVKIERELTAPPYIQSRGEFLSSVVLMIYQIDSDV